MSGGLEFRRRIERLARMENIKDAKRAMENDATKEKQEEKKEKKMILPSIDGVRKNIDNFQKKKDKEIEDEER